MAIRLGTLRQVGIAVHNMERAISFYKDKLGRPLIAAPGQLAFFDLDGVRLFLEQGDVVGGSVMYLAVSDIRFARAELEARGVEFVDEPHLIHRDVDGVYEPAGEEEWMTFFQDSEGNLLALSSREVPTE
jgi:catechol 2,3-dioxygenase-like lactoylglutathione lyase family enzyme